MASAGGLQVHETPHKQAQRLCNQVYGASSLPDSQHGHWLCDCYHDNLVLVGLHDDGYSPVPAGSPHHHFRAVSHSAATVLMPPQTPEEDKGCQSCSACSHGCTTKQELQQFGVRREPIAASAPVRAAAAAAVSEKQPRR